MNTKVKAIVGRNGEIREISVAKTIKAYPNVTIEFDETKHQLFVNGERNTNNVTGITKIIDKSAPLMYWAVNLMKEDLLDRLAIGENITTDSVNYASHLHTEAKERARSIGDMIHEYAEQWSLGLKPELPEDERARNGALAFLKWLDEEKISIKNPEEVIYSKKHDYWGVKDSDGSRGKELFVVDYKTSKGVYPEFRLQTAAYLFASQEMLGRKYAGYWIVKFGKDDGNFEPLYVPLKEAKKDFQAFLAAYELKKRIAQIGNHKNGK